MGELAELVLLYLLRGGHREDVHEVDVLRDLEPRDAVLAERRHVVLGDVGAVGADDERGRLLAVLLRGAADYGDVLDARHGAEEVLDLLGGDVLAAADDEVLEPPGDVVVAVGVHAADVAGMEPAALVDALRCLLGHLVVALHRVESAAAYLAVDAYGRELLRVGVDDRDLDAGERLADCLALALDRRLKITRHRHDGSALGQAVGVADLLHVHPVKHLLHPVDRARGAGHDAGPEAREVELLEERMVQHGDVHRRHAVRRRAALALDGGHHLHRVELLEEHHRRAVVDAAHDAEDASEAVEERHGDADAVARRQVLARADPKAVVRYVAVGELYALGEAGRAAGVLHVHDVVDAAFRLAREVVLPRRLDGERHHLVERVHSPVLLAAEEHDPLQVGVLRGLEAVPWADLELRDELVQNLHVVAVAEARDYEDVLRVGLPEREVELALLVVGVERQEDGADLRGGEHQDDPVRDVRGPEGDLLAVPDAEGHEAAREAVDLLAELVPRKPEVAVGVDDGVVLAASRDRLVEELPERVLPGNRQVVPWHAPGHAL